MKKIPNAVYAVVIAVMFLAGSVYLIGSSNRVAAQIVGLSQVSVQQEDQEHARSENRVQEVSRSNRNTADAASPSAHQNQENLVQPTANGFFIDVDVTAQKVLIYENNQLVKECLVSTGKNDATPLGRFKIQNRGEWFFSEKYQQGAMWWVSFKDWGTYLFHSLPMDRDQKLITEEADKLGMPASHGCVRLKLEDAKWIYDHIPEGADVYIHK